MIKTTAPRGGLFLFLPTKRGVFVDGNGKMSLPSTKRAAFVDGSSGYLLYLHDLNENLN